MNKLFTVAALAAILTSVGCDVDVHETSPAISPAPSSDVDGVNVDVADTPVEERMERRDERRENLRDAVDGVDVQVGNGGVKVDVDDK